MPPDLSTVLDQLGTSAERDSYDDAERRFGPVHSVVARARAQARVGVDAGDLEPVEVRAWLFDLDVPAEASVVVLWPFDRLGTQMTYRSFVDRYDDLWYPASDDVVVYWDNGDDTSVVVLDHEEEFTFAVLSRSVGSDQR